WSKDEILGSAFGLGRYGYALWLVGLFAALLTAFYMSRQWVMVFLGESRWNEGVEPHESPRSMTIPLIVLAVLSIVGGSVNTPFRFTLEHYLEPVFEGVNQIHPPEGWFSFAVLAALSLLAAIIGLVSGYLVYRRPVESWVRFREQLGRTWGLWEGAYFVDDIYGKVVVAPGKRASEYAAFMVDKGLIDGAATGIAGLVKRLGRALQPLQSGFVRGYAALFVIGTVVIVAWLVVDGWL
ncbi:MAG: NADH-quinone oxidoreductase subunit L, partial [Acidimicrobiia bacterium]|nr:NADH-quinone oxidoreductase subunit L [Acidimicrobiia bacterium]